MFVEFERKKAEETIQASQDAARKQQAEEAEKAKQYKEDKKKEYENYL